MNSEGYGELSVKEVSMAFAEELSAFRKTHPFSEVDVDGVTTSYLLCGNPDSKLTLVYLVGGTGFSVVWFKHILQMEREYRILTVADKAFPPEAQEDLMNMMPRAVVEQLEGGHVATLYKVDEYVNATKVFLQKLNTGSGNGPEEMG